MLVIVVVLLGLGAIRLLVTVGERPSFDTFAHLYFAKEVKRQEAGPFGEITTKVVGSKGFRQPFLWHWLVSRFPIPLVLSNQRWINPVLDAIFGAFLYVVALSLGFGREAAAWTAVLYLSTPMWFSKFSQGPRLANLTPRLFAEVITNIFFIVTLVPLGLPLWGVIGGGSITAAAVLLSSKFGLQALVFLVPLVAVLTGSTLIIVSLAGGIVLALIVSRGQFLHSLARQINHLIWYFRKNLEGEMPISDRNSVARLIRGKGDHGDPREYLLRLAQRMLSLNSFTSVFIKMPVLYVGVGLCIWLSVTGGTMPPGHLIAPVVAALAVYFIINLPTFLFLGEAERYLNHVAFFIVASCVYASINAGMQWLLVFLVAYGLLYLAVEFVASSTLFAERNHERERCDRNVISYLNSLDDRTVVLLYPFGAAVGVFRVMLETPHKVLYNFTTMEEFAEKFEREYAADYPYVDLTKLESMAGEFRVGVLVAYEKALVERGYTDWDPGEAWRSRDVGEPLYRTYRRVAHRD